MPFNLFSPATWFGDVGNSQQFPTGLFQSRVTHTPGIVGPTTGPPAEYAPTAQPSDYLAGLTPAQKAAVMPSFTGQGLGFITIAPEYSQRSDLLQHEQMHDLLAKSGALEHAAEIAPLVGPSVQEGIRSDPRYQQEAKQYGWTNVMADEGTAAALTNQRNRMEAAQENPALQAKVRQFLKTREQQKQFQQLTQLPGQSQK